MITKVLKIYDNDTPLLVVTYEVDLKGRLIRNDISIQNGSLVGDRYFGKTPVVFVPKENRLKLEALNLANLTKLALDNDLEVTHERHIKLALKNVLRGKELVFKKESFEKEIAEVKVKRPNNDYFPFKHIMFRKLAKSIVENAVVKNEH